MGRWVWSHALDYLTCGTGRLFYSFISCVCWLDSLEISPTKSFLSLFFFKSRAQPQPHLQKTNLHRQDVSFILSA
jgi:hypothetical protein